MSAPDQLTVLAWVGEDEHGSGETGIKRILSSGPGGIQYHALAYVENATNDVAAVTYPALLQALQDTVNQFGKPMRLVRLQVTEELLEIHPERRHEH